MKTSIKFNRWIKQRKPKTFKQLEAKSHSLVLSAVGVIALGKQEMCAEGRQFIFKSQALCSGQIN